MKLSDIMKHAGLAGYAELAMILFLVVFIGIAIATLRPGNRRAMDAASRLPFDDEPDARPQEEPRS